MSSPWIIFVKQVQQREGCSYKEALQIASKEYNKEGGKIAVPLHNRIGYKPSMREILEQIGDRRIISMMIVRRPLGKALNTIINQISKPHDQLFHLFLIINVQGTGNYYILEKNEDLNMYHNYKPHPLDERMYVETGVRSDLTINKLLENTRNAIGDKAMFDYNAFNNNCQKFVYDVLKSNGLLRQNHTEFIMQNVENLVPHWAKKVAYFFTSLKNRLNQTVQGEGEE